MSTSVLHRWGHGLVAPITWLWEPDDDRSLWPKDFSTQSSDIGPEFLGCLSFHES